MLSKREKELVVAVETIASRHFNLSSLVFNEIPNQILHEDLYTLEEVAEILTMSIVTVRQYVRKGKLNAIKQWRNWMVPSNEVAKIIYERKHGLKLPTNKPMLAVVEGDLYKDDTPFDKYEIITIEDILQNANWEGEGTLDDAVWEYTKTILPGSVNVYIEAVSNIENFFNRSSDINYANLQKIEAPIWDFFPENEEITNFIEKNLEELALETPEKALKRIELLFGKPEDKLTILRVYKLLIESTAKQLGEDFED